MPRSSTCRTATKCTISRSKIRIHGIRFNTKIVHIFFSDKSALYELKIGELMSLKFDRESHVMVFAVHSHPEHCMKTIDATNALGVMLGKKPNQYQFTSPQSCPFTASSGTNEVYYKPLKDKTFGKINGAVLKVDQILSIRPTMISANECNANQEQIGNECLTLILFNLSFSGEITYKLF